MRMLVVSGLLLTSALGVASARADDGIAGWGCHATADDGVVLLEYDESRQLEGRAVLRWQASEGLVRIAFTMQVTGPGQLAPAYDLQVGVGSPADAPRLVWLEITGDGQVLFAEQVELRPYLVGGPPSHLFSNQRWAQRPVEAEAEGRVMAGAWAARSLNVRVLDDERRPIADETFALTDPDTRALPLLARAEGRFDDRTVCKVRYWYY